jgi:hypothetical protein
MAQVTWRAPDELVDRVRRAAVARQSSVNEYLTAVLDAATNPETAGSEAEALRERLARAGLLATPTPRSKPRPAAAQLAAARKRAGRGTPLSDFVSEGR